MSHHASHRVHQAALLWAACVALGSGCGDLPAVTPAEPRAPITPVEPALQPPSDPTLAPEGQAQVSALRPQPVAWMTVTPEGAIWSLDKPDQDAPASPRALWRLSPEGELEARGALDAAAQPAALVELDQGRALLSTQPSGLLLYEPERGWTPSPLSGLLGRWPAMSLARQGDALWMSTEQGVLLWRQGELLKVQPSAMPQQGPWRLAARTQGAWAAGPGGVYGLSLGPQGDVSLVSAQRELEAAALGSALEDQLWILHQGQAMRRDARGAWSRLTHAPRITRDDAPQGPSAALVALAAHPRCQDVWLRTDQGQTLHWDGQSLWRVQGDPWGDLVAQDATCRLIVAGPQGLSAVDRRYRVILKAPEQALVEPTLLSLDVTFAQELEALSVSVLASGLTLEVSEPGQGAAQTRHVPLDPARLGPGRHALRAVASYRGGRQASAQIEVVVGQIDYTWAEHVEPLFKASCAGCHGVRAHRELHTPAQWQADFDNIMDQVERGLMPLPPFGRFDAGQLRMLDLWRQRGFP